MKNAQFSIVQVIHDIQAVRWMHLSQPQFPYMKGMRLCLHSVAIVLVMELFTTCLLLNVVTHNCKHFPFKGRMVSGNDEECGAI